MSKNPVHWLDQGNQLPGWIHGHVLFSKGQWPDTENYITGQVATPRHKENQLELFSFCSHEHLAIFTPGRESEHSDSSPGMGKLLGHDLHLPCDEEGWRDRLQRKPSLPLFSATYGQLHSVEGIPQILNTLFLPKGFLKSLKWVCVYLFREKWTYSPP